jgi:hypothetical protein
MTDRRPAANNKTMNLYKNYQPLCERHHTKMSAEQIEKYETVAKLLGDKFWKATKEQIIKYLK